MKKVLVTVLSMFLIAAACNKVPILNQPASDNKDTKPLPSLKQNPGFITPKGSDAIHADSHENITWNPGGQKGDYSIFDQLLQGDGQWQILPTTGTIGQVKIESGKQDWYVDPNKYDSGLHKLVISKSTAATPVFESGIFCIEADPSFGCDKTLSDYKLSLDTENSRPVDEIANRKKYANTVLGFDMLVPNTWQAPSEKDFFPIFTDCANKDILPCKKMTINFADYDSKSNSLGTLALDPRYTVKTVYGIPSSASDTNSTDSISLVNEADKIIEIIGPDSNDGSLLYEFDAFSIARKRVFVFSTNYINMVRSVIPSVRFFYPEITDSNAIITQFDHTAISGNAVDQGKPIIVKLVLANINDPTDKHIFIIDSHVGQTSKAITTYQSGFMTFQFVGARYLHKGKWRIQSVTYNGKPFNNIPKHTIEF